MELKEIEESKEYFIHRTFFAIGVYVYINKKDKI